MFRNIANNHIFQRSKIEKFPNFSFPYHFPFCHPKSVSTHIFFYFKELIACVLAFYKISFPMHFNVVQSIFLPAIYMDILTKITFCLPHTNLNKAKDIDAWILVYSKMSFLIHFILTLPTGRFFSAIYIYILTKMAFCIPHTNLSKTKDLYACVLVFSKMSFLIHFILKFFGCLIFSTIYMTIVERTSYPILKRANSRNFNFFLDT